MKIVSLKMHDYCGYRDAEFEFRDFACLVGPNGVGKTTILNAVSLLCSSLDFKTDEADSNPGAFKTRISISPEQRVKAYLKRNIRNVDDEGGCKAFRLEGVFEHEGQRLQVFLTENGFEKNEILDKPFWWAGICYFAKFDSDMVNFQLRYDLWPKFKKAYEGITGIEIEPEVLNETDLKKFNQDTQIVVGFFMKKHGDKIHSKRGSAGERKIAKSLSQVVNLEEARQPSIVLVDNIEMHVHYKRHLAMLEEIKELFAGKQIISTTHSLPIINSYEPKEDMIDIEAMLERINYARTNAAPSA